jgi:hypothetical protein
METDGGLWRPTANLIAALGTWSNPKTDTLTIERTGPLTESRRTGRLRGGGTMPTDCAFYNDVRLPVRVSLRTTDGRFNELFEATLVLEQISSIGFRSALMLDALKGSLRPAEPTDGVLDLNARFSAPGALNASAQKGTWSIGGSVASKPIVLGNSASAGAAVIWIADFETRSDDVLVGP